MLSIRTVEHVFNIINTQTVCVFSHQKSTHITVYSGNSLLSMARGRYMFITYIMYHYLVDPRITVLV